MIDTLPLPLRLRRTRTLLKVTQRQAADAMGIRRDTISRIEQANWRPRPQTVTLIETWITRATEGMEI